MFIKNLKNISDRLVERFKGKKISIKEIRVLHYKHGTSDKVYVLLILDVRYNQWVRYYIRFWGRNGSIYRTSDIESNPEYFRLKGEKLNEGYVQKVESMKWLKDLLEENFWEGGFTQFEIEGLDLVKSLLTG